jgi:hypothetical protein
LVELRHRFALQAKADIDGCRQADAIPSNGVLDLSRGLQSQIIQKQYVSWQNEAHTLVSQLTWIEQVPLPNRFHRDADIAARNRHLHEPSEDNGDQRCYHQADQQHRQMAPRQSATMHSAFGSRVTYRPSSRDEIRLHQPFATER